MLASVRDGSAFRARSRMPVQIPFCSIFTDEKINLDQIDTRERRLQEACSKKREFMIF